MAKSVTINGVGTINVVPNSSTIKIVGGYFKDEHIIELHDGLRIRDVQAVSSNLAVDVGIEKFEGYTYQNNLNKDIGILVITNKRKVKDDKGEDRFLFYPKDKEEYFIDNKDITGSKFTVTIENIITGEIYYTLTCNVEKEYDDNGVDFSILRKWATNNNYGSGYLTLKDKDVSFFGNIIKYNSAFELIGIVNSLEVKLKGPRYNTVSSDNNILQMVDTPTSLTSTESGVSITKNTQSVTTKKAGLVGIHSTPVFGNNNVVIGKSVNMAFIVNPINVNTSTPNEVNLKWNESYILSLSNTYPLIKKGSTIHTNCLQSVDTLSVKWDNQQNDIIHINHYIADDKFHCVVQAKAKTDRSGIIGYQIHQAHAWDNGLYQTLNRTFNINPGTDETPMHLYKNDITIYVGESYEYILTTPGDNYSYSVDKKNIVSVDKDKHSVLGLREGKAVVTFNSTYGDFGEGSVELNVTVLKLPEPTIEVNKRVIIVSVGRYKSLKVKAVKADSLKFEDSPAGLFSIVEDSTIDKETLSIDSTLIIKGEEIGVSTLLVKSMYKGVEQLTEIIEVHVIKEGEWLIIADPTKLKVDIKKNATKPVKLLAYTNCYYIKHSYPEQNSFYHKGDYEYDTLEIDIYPKTVKGKYVITLRGHNQDPNTTLCTLEVPITVTKNVEVPKDQIWLGLEHKQIGKSDFTEDLDYRYFTIIKWLDRKTMEEVSNHRLILPNKSGTLLSAKTLDENSKFGKRYYNYATSKEPDRTINPTKVDMVWLDTSTGLVWKCIDNATDDNVWVCEDGKQIGRVDKLVYPEPGEKGFGVGPMSADLHKSYGLTPLEGCFDRNSDNYGNYKDNYGNIYVCIPKHYVRLNPTTNIYSKNDLKKDKK